MPATLATPSVADKPVSTHAQLVINYRLPKVSNMLETSAALCLILPDILQTKEEPGTKLL
jgi:hypothetical protein